jgi:pimeloyl-ACP methyl ester carboxylesterase
MFRPSRRSTFLALVGVTITACGGATTSPVPSSTPLATPAPTHRLVEVDGRTQAIDCRGTGSPTVVLDGGLGVYSGTWTDVMGALSDAPFRVCRYDRPGLGESEAGEKPRTSERFVEELRTLLEAAGESGPYVLVGHSLGGLNVQLFARQHPNDVVGAVFVDAVHPDLDARIAELLTPEQAAQRGEELEVNQEGITFEDILASDEQVREAPEFPAIPVVVIAHGRPFEVTDPEWPARKVESLWTELQRDLSELAPGGKLVIAEESEHRIQETEPSVVADAIGEVVAAAGGQS